MKTYAIYLDPINIVSIITSSDPTFTPPDNHIDITDYPNKQDIVNNMENYKVDNGVVIEK